MRVFNVEIFNSNFEFVSCGTVSNPKYEFDYLALEPNTVKVPKVEGQEPIKAIKGDYIRMQSDVEEISGIVTGIQSEKGYVKIDYKSLLKMTDVNVHYDAEQLHSMTLEEWIAGIIRDTYVNNADADQNLHGMRIEVTSSTEAALLDLDSNIGNLNTIMVKALTTYNIVVDIRLDIGVKEIVVTIGKVSEKAQTIEADLPNITNRYFETNDGKDSVNKITVYNENDETQSLTYYLTKEGIIVQVPAESEKILPVIFDTEYVSFTESTSSSIFFEDKAYERALNRLTPTPFDNLIKLECASDDELIKPGEMKIGQTVNIIYDGTVYNSILTGKTEALKTILIFGKIRNELTKILRRNMG